MARYSEKERAYNKAYREAHLEEMRAYNFMYRFGITIEEYNIMLAAQNGTCSICGNPPNGKHLAIDHNHDTGKIRGLLCDRCNMVLGKMNSAELLGKAANYLALKDAGQGELL